MIFCDVTLAYNEASGGIRTYIDQKRKYLLEHTEDEHLLIIPGEDHHTEEGDRWRTVTIASPVVPGLAPYRFMWRADKINSALDEYAPEFVEFGSYFLSPWAALGYRERQVKRGRPVVVGGYFHTDIAEAYFSGPLGSILSGPFEDWSETLSSIGVQIGDLAGSGAEIFFGYLFQRCDLVFAATQAQADRLHDYNVSDAHIVPLGVDPDLFHPDKRDAEIREQYGVSGEQILLMFAGRLVEEKQVEVVADALELLPADEYKFLLAGEGGLREKLEARAEKTPNLILENFKEDREEYARLLASADIYVTAGPYETFGLSIVEAQACGLPVVGVDSGALQHHVKESENTGFLGPVGDPEAMAENIRRVAENLPSMKESARERVLSSGYTWDSTFEKLCSLYRENFAEKK